MSGRNSFSLYLCVRRIIKIILDGVYFIFLCAYMFIIFIFRYVGGQGWGTEQDRQRINT